MHFLAAIVLLVAITINSEAPLLSSALEHVGVHNSFLLLYIAFVVWFSVVLSVRRRLLLKQLSQRLRQYDEQFGLAAAEPWLVTLSTVANGMSTEVTDAAVEDALDDFIAGEIVEGLEYLMIAAAIQGVSEFVRNLVRNPEQVRLESEIRAGVAKVRAMRGAFWASALLIAPLTYLAYRQVA